MTIRLGLSYQLVQEAEMARVCRFTLPVLQHIREELQFRCAREGSPAAQEALHLCQLRVVNFPTEPASLAGSGRR